MFVLSYGFSSIIYLIHSYYQTFPMSSVYIEEYNSSG